VLHLKLDMQDFDDQMVTRRNRSGYIFQGNIVPVYSSMLSPTGTEDNHSAHSAEENAMSAFFEDPKLMQQARAQIQAHGNVLHEESAHGKIQLHFLY
jgi:hypothetical protein